MSSQLSLFGDRVDVYETAKRRYGVWPLTVWDVDHQDKTYHKLKGLIGDDGQGRGECFTKETQDKSVYRGKVTESIFNPQIGIWLLNCFAPSSGHCFDPFGGGGTRAILAAKHGLSYTGIELRKAEVDAVNRRCLQNGVADRVNIIQGDARNAVALVGERGADFLLTCPPYYDLETYNGGSADLSMAPSYHAFLEGMGRVVRQCFSVMCHGTTSVWVVGLHRNTNGELLALNHDIARLHREAGFLLKEEIILAHRNNGAIQRVGNFEKGNRWLVRTHEYALVFRKK